MSLKNRIFEVASKKIANKIKVEGHVDKAVNDLIEKLVKASGIKSLNDYMEMKENNYMVFKVPSATIGTIVNLFRNPDSVIEKFGSIYQFCDIKGKVKYISDFDTGLILDRDTVTLYDEKKRVYGKVKECLVSPRMPLFEKKVKKCNVNLEKNNLCKIKKRVLFGSLEFVTLEGKMYIEYVDEKQFNIKKENKTIAKVNELPLKLIDGLVERYIIEYENIEDEKIITLMIVTLYILMCD